jgi:hypothetical protein
MTLSFLARRRLLYVAPAGPASRRRATGALCMRVAPEGRPDLFAMHKAGASARFGPVAAARER